MRWLALRVRTVSGPASPVDSVVFDRQMQPVIMQTEVHTLHPNGVREP